VEGEVDGVEAAAESELLLPSEPPFFSSLEPPFFSSLSAFFRDSEG
jgi:hypothetical protein